ncbi:choline-binding protein [Lapidilactobacillus bayanensis]|uniref:choline-binding protein n=1 Tax=Lapidilactobacillus bayanensis TaxID=2485998 RepID=UPI000F77206B|nr:choline-binding protein [Lapidilactobacillus bayanensis]
MKFKSKALMTIFTSILLSGSSVALAATWTIGSVSVPAWGGSARTSESNTKATTSNYASFNGDVQPNSFGYTVTLADSNNASRTSQVGLYLNKTSRASDNTLTVNHYGYGKVFSKGYEPNSSRVKLHFSADKK